jgi:glycosyltransferase involved in cell wall biosynthesis
MISIITPSFNKAAYIGETIQSVLNQTYPDWELIIVDDGSTDGSIEFIEKFCDLDDRIKFIQRDSLQQGGSACRNIGLNTSKGEYLIFLDADDVIAPNCLSQRLYEINNNSNNNMWVFPIGTFYKELGDSESEWIPKGSGFLLRFLKHDLAWQTMSVVWKKEFIESLGGFDVVYPRLQDVELHTRALLSEQVKLIVFPDNIKDAYYRIDTNRTVQNLEQQLTKQMNGVFLYINKISFLLKTGQQKNAIKGTLFSLVTVINYKSIGQHKDFCLNDKLLLKIKEFMSTNIMFSKRDSFYILMYTALYKKGMWKVKGYNYLLKKMF